MTHEFFKIGITAPEEEISIVTAFFSLRSVFHGCASGMVENPLNGFTHGRNPFLVQYPTDDRSTVFMVFPDCRFCFIADLNWVRLKVHLLLSPVTNKKVIVSGLVKIVYELFSRIRKTSQ